MTPTVGGKSDPLNQRPDAERELFTRLSQMARGFEHDVVVGAAANVLLNSIRQNKATRQQAEAAFDDLFGRLKAILVDHYDEAGRRRSVFPHPQVIEVPVIRFRKS